MNEPQREVTPRIPLPVVNFSAIFGAGAYLEYTVDAGVGQGCASHAGYNGFPRPKSRAEAVYGITCGGIFPFRHGIHEGMCEYLGSGCALVTCSGGGL